LIECANIAPENKILQYIISELFYFFLLQLDPKGENNPRIGASRNQGQENTMINHPNRSKSKITLNPTMTLKAIRDQSPCSDGWKKLLSALGYTNGDYGPNRLVSLGDVATSNDAEDAIWCVRALDWSYIAVRRAVISGAVLPAIKRASQHTKDKRVFESIDIIERWCAGDDKADLKKASKIAADAAYAYAADAAADAAAYAADAAAAYAADAAYAYAADAAYAYAADAAARKAEREQQRQDIIAAFPPIALTKDVT
jgi:hypothetical protein